MPFRFSGKPSKQLLWLFLARDMRLTHGREIGLDVGCGFMQNRPFFRTRRYVGVDLDPERLARGKARYPEAETVAARLEALDGIAGDAVLCVQMFVNKHFDVEKTLAGVEALVRATRPGGVLLFNISKRNFAFEPAIDRLLGERFARVRKVRYGALSAPDIGLASPFIALAMLLLPPLRRGRGYSKIYYRCEGRR